MLPKLKQVCCQKLKQVANSSFHTVFWWICFLSSVLFGSNSTFLALMQMQKIYIFKASSFFFFCYFCSVIQSCPTLCNLMDCSKPGFPVLHHLPELGQTHVHWVGDVIQPSHPLLFPSPPDLSLSKHHPLLFLISEFPSNRVFSNEKALHIKWSKYWSFSLSVSPSSEYSGLISFRMERFALAVQGILKSSPTTHFKSINSSVLSLLYVLALTSIQDYWKTSFSYTIEELLLNLNLQCNEILNGRHQDKKLIQFSVSF